MHLANPYFFLFLGFIPLYLWLEYRFRGRSAAIEYSSVDLIAGGKASWIKNRDKILKWLRIAAIVLFVVALARPQLGQFSEEVTSEGIDIILCMDTSTSMKAEDFKPNNRYYVAKKTAQNFVKLRKHDRIGVVVFAALSFTQCPLTFDHAAVLDLLEKSEIGMVQEDGTAIGSALATAVNRLRTSEAKSKVIILLSDGRNNRGEIDPVTAAKIASSMDIKIYAIGAGAPGPALYPVDDPVFGRRYVRLAEDLDEVTLKKIADLTGGMYFRATSSDGLEEIFRRIDKMEKVPIKTKEYTQYIDLYLFFLIPALALFMLEIVLANTLLLKIP